MAKEDVAAMAGVEAAPVAAVVWVALLVRILFSGIVSWPITGSVSIAVAGRQLFNIYLVRSSRVIRVSFHQFHCIQFSFF